MSQDSNDHIHAEQYIQLFGGPQEFTRKPTDKMDPESFARMFSMDSLPS